MLAFTDFANVQVDKLKNINPTKAAVWFETEMPDRVALRHRFRGHPSRLLRVVGTGQLLLYIFF